MSYIKIKSRFYFSQDITIGKYLRLDNDIFYHAIIVLRAKLSDIITLFNETSGEFVAKIIEINKKSMLVEIIEKIRSFEPSLCKIHLAYAPLKKDANDFVIEKSCELGVSGISNIITDRTVNKAIEINKFEQKLIQASQQCGRLDVPLVNPTKSLTSFLEENKENNIFWLYEKYTSNNLTYYIRLLQKDKKTINPIFLVGPEGGFSDNEVMTLTSFSNILPVHLNMNTLRAETACIASITAFQALYCNL